METMNIILTRMASDILSGGGKKVGKEATLALAKKHIVKLII